MSWEDKFTSWSQPPGKTEKEKMKNAESAIQKAIASDSALNDLDVSVFSQGSYKARTNIAQDSDVDICIRLNSTFFSHYPEGKTREDYGNTPGSISFSAFKKLVQTALENYFGTENVERGKKAFDVHSNSYRVDADAVPTFAYRHYYGGETEDYRKPVGVQFISDNGKVITNWPKQAYDNGVAKLNATQKRFKKIVRILKRLRNEMQKNDIEASADVASFLIESLVWNAPNTCFGHETLYFDVREVLAHCFNKTITDEDCKEMCEVNDIKYLFHKSQPWSRESAHAFLSAAWDYVEFE